MELVVNDDGSWRVSSVYGLTRAALVLEGSPKTTLEAGRPLHVASEAAPLELVDAYQLLLDLRPPKGDAFEPAMIEVRYWDFENARGEVPWPSDVPPPPTDAVSHEDRGGASHMVCPKHLASLERALETAYASDPPKAIELDGHKWAINPLLRYRGQETIDRVVRHSHQR
jgi:hypothetical protein